MLGFGVSKKAFAAAKERDQTAFSVERVVEETRRAAGTYVAAADDVVADIAADTSCFALPQIAAAAKHSLGVYIERQLAASGALHTPVQLHHTPGKPSACPRTAPSADAEGTFVVAVLAVGISNRTAAADVEDSYTAGSRQAHTTKADSSRALAPAAASLVGLGHGHEKACSS
ncbi:hypothetical protein IL306_000859 [Fusarium sp. DS 682]|nr:hypothetical protein IL306_000859 [Fusarium sp. DS 682]